MIQTILILAQNSNDQNLFQLRKLGSIMEGNLKSSDPCFISLEIDADMENTIILFDKHVWEQKPFLGRYAQRIRNADIHILRSNRWLQNGGLKTGTEGLIMITQRKSLPIRNSQANIINPICVDYMTKIESIKHFASSCQISTPIGYKE